MFKISTPVGATGEGCVREAVGQGTVEGAIVSAVSIRELVNEFLYDSPHEVWYDKFRLQPVIFHDNVARMATGRKEAEVGNRLMEIVAENKRLNFNVGKSAVMIVGGKVVKKKEEEEDLNNNPMML